MKTLNCMVFDPETGQSTYDQERNPLLVRGLSSSTYLFIRWVRQGRNNSEHATPEAARAFVAALNAAFGSGFSLADPEGTQGGLLGFGAVTWSEPMQIVARPDGSTFHAGLIGFILGLESEWANARMRDYAICDLAGVPYDAAKPSISDAILSAVGV